MQTKKNMIQPFRIRARLRRFVAACFVALLAMAMLMGCRSDLSTARECYRIGDFARAKTYFEKAIDQDPTDFDARYGYALSVQEICLRKKSLGQDQVQDWMEVVRAYDISTKVGNAPSQSPNHAFALFHLSNKLYQQQRFSQARDYLKVARGIEPRNKYVLNLTGIVAYKLGDYRDAQQTLEYLLAIDPDFISAYLNLGNVLWEAGDPESALVTWKQGLERSPGNGALIQRMSTAVKKIGAP
jgi:tetratricopeptide (TPR) repeat protein